jgi:Tfp pilus assembly PilM family ATPase
LVTASSPIASRTLDLDAAALEQKDVADEVVREVQHLVGQRELTKIILAGKSARLPEVAETLAALLGQAPEVINPWHGLAYQVELEKVMSEVGPSVATAIGLARSRLPHKI